LTPPRPTSLGVTAAPAAAALADDLFGLPRAALSADTGGAPSAELGKLAAVALDRARALGATYADIRINRYRDQVVALRSNPDRDSGTLNHVPSVNETRSFGFGVRVIANGTWGFAASSIVSPQEIDRVTAAAVAVAKANAALQKAPVVLAPVKSYVDRYTTPFRKNPFDVSIPDKLALLQEANTEARSVASVFSASSSIVTHTEDRYFASTEGSRIQQYVVQNYAQLSAQAVDRAAGLSRTRNYSPSPVTAGFEAIEEADLKGNARRVGEEVVEHLKAPPVAPGVKDVVLMPNHLALTIHESVGHATELDRVLGYEANYAGTSFLKPGDLGTLKYGSEWMNVVGDRTLERGMSTCAYDDDGVKTTSFDIVKGGILVGFQTIRDQAHLIGEKESRGCAYADSFDSVPFQRIPNVWLKPGEKPMTVDDLVAGVDDGVLIDGRGSWSIDHQRYNFQFGGDAFWEIKGGKRGRMISRVAYQSRTPDFWASLDGVADKRFWVNHGLTSDGKGQPGQINAMSHGCAPSRFRRVNVLLTD
jgi:TldD protein